MNRYEFTILYVFIRSTRTGRWRHHCAVQTACQCCIAMYYRYLCCVVICDHRACIFQKVKKRNGHWTCLMSTSRRTEEDTHACYMCVRSACARLVYVYYYCMCEIFCFRKTHFFISPGRRSPSCSRLRGTQGRRMHTTAQIRAPTEVHGARSWLPVANSGKYLRGGTPTC